MNRPKGLETMKGAGRFPTTRWTLLASINDLDEEDKRDALNVIIGDYWRPAYAYARSRGWSHEEASDIVQDFFAQWLQKHSFERANPNRGRFRSYFLASLRNFMADVRRKAYAKHRRPPGGILSIEELASTERLPFEPSHEDSPEAVFHRMWATDLFLRVLKVYKAECEQAGRTIHYHIFLKRVIEPALYGAEPVSFNELAAMHGLSQKETSNRLVSARRSYQRLLHGEVLKYAMNEKDVELEIQEIFAHLS